MKCGKCTSVQLLAGGFAGIILLGGILLHLPAASRGGVPLPFLNAIFTSASATCVTGLVVCDTWTQFSLFGQIVILLLIQVGGLGFITSAVAIPLIMHRRIGLWQRSVLAESVGISQLAGVVRLARRILLGTALFEGGGAALLAIRFVPEFGWGRGVWFAVFHSVSAFCNAGFDLMGARKPGSSLTAYCGDPLVVLTISALIVIGGIGFIVWNDLWECCGAHRRPSLHTRVTLAATGALLAAGTAAFLILERGGVLAGMGAGERFLAALFQSVTTRTAGFNTVEISALSDAGKAVSIFLMFVGAAPGGTGGGIKVTTLVVMLSAVVSSLRREDDVELGRARLEAKTISRAFCNVFAYVGMVFPAILLLCAQGSAFTDSAFECFSAIGTVGLSVGITSSLAPASKLAVILLMYFGRVGSLTVFLAVTKKERPAGLRNPVGAVIVG